MFVRREPCAALRPFVTTMWAQRAERERVDLRGDALERVLPTGAVHVVFRLGDSPLRVLDVRGHETRVVGAVVGGPRASAYLKDVSGAEETVGVQLRVGATALIFPGSAQALADAHTPLDALWGADAERLRARLAEEPVLARRLDRLEAALLERARDAFVRPDLAHAIALVARGGSLDSACRTTGLRERRFRDVFTDVVGLAPKTFARVARLGRALDALAAPSADPADTRDASAADPADLTAPSAADPADLTAPSAVDPADLTAPSAADPADKKGPSAADPADEKGPAPSLATIAFEAGFADQAHLQREMKAITGLTPAVYRSRRPRHPHHVRA